MNPLRDLLRDERGEDLIEYGLLAAFVASIALFVLMDLSLRDALKAAFEKAVQALTTIGQ